MFLIDVCYMNNNYANFKLEKKYNTCKEVGNSKALLYRVLEGNLRTFIKELCVTLFQSRDEIHEAGRKLSCMK